MSSLAGIDQVDRALTALDGALADLGAVLGDLTLSSADEAIGLLRGLERSSGRLVALQIDAMAQVDRQGLHLVDGHGSLKAMVRHVCRLSNATATSRARVMRMLVDLPEVSTGLRAGTVGIDQVALLARVHANARVRDAMAEYDGWFCDRATRLSFRDFESLVRQWERLIDEDGPEPANSRNHERRDASLVQNKFDLSWSLTGSYAALSGAAMREIFDHYIDAELVADWEKAKANIGADACFSDLDRSDAQRRADALWQIFQDAAAGDTGAVPPGFVHNIVWDANSFEEMVARLDDNQEPQPLPRPLRPLRSLRSLKVEQFRCETVDGVPLEPAEAIANATVSAVRRVVVDARGVTIDLGQARLFTGNARHAVRLSDRCCVWPGCEVPTSRCEIDHLREHSNRGATNPGNGAVMCGKHNRWKQKGYAVHRDQAGNWHTYRPNGERVP